ncbi:hypothetical protein, partial [Mesorhizobium sp. M7A.F.Ca.ET.027.03.2.1]|uniref:hypothetical protein n=1 Tax=Mesorhizobium sp. M7A.F.Ca.ET.027.03.2.1 TaxID=2496656 RepID=UPI001AECE1D5
YWRPTSETGWSSAQQAGEFSSIERQRPVEIRHKHQAAADRSCGSILPLRFLSAPRARILPVFGKVVARESGFHFHHSKVSSSHEPELDDDRGGNQNVSHA